RAWARISVASSTTASITVSSGLRAWLRSYPRRRSLPDGTARGGRDPRGPPGARLRLVEELRHVALGQAQVAFGRRIGRVTQPQLSAQPAELGEGPGAYLGSGVLPGGQVEQAVENRALRDSAQRGVSGRGVRGRVPGGHQPAQQAGQGEGAVTRG